MKNYLLLEGVEMYVFLFLFLSLLAIGLIGLVTGIKHDIKREQLKDKLSDEELKVLELNRENMRLKLKCGEQNAVCPECDSYEYTKFDTQIEKDDVLDALLNVIMHLNNHYNELYHIYGLFTQNADLGEIYGIADELIAIMYDEFATPQICNAIRHIRDEEDIRKVSARLRGITR